MPHKRAKRSKREDEKKKAGSDLAPTQQNAQGEASLVSKRALWVLGAEKVRNEYRERKKRMREEGVEGNDDGSQTPSKKKRRKSEPSGKLPHKILPGETLGQFNRRVEDDLRPGIRTAFKTSSVITKAAQTKKASSSADEPSESPSSTSQSKNIAKTSLSSKDSEREFASRPKTTRLNDIAQAPPSLTKATKKAPARSAGVGGVVSDEKKLEMEQERERAIKRYRELKEMKLNANAKANASKASSKLKAKG